MYFNERANANVIDTIGRSICQKLLQDIGSVTISFY